MGGMFDSEVELCHARNVSEFLERLDEGGIGGVFLPTDDSGQNAEVRSSGSRLAVSFMMLDFCPDGAAVIDKESNVVWVNRRLADWFSGSPMVDLSFYEALGNPIISGPEIHPISTAIKSRRNATTTLSQGDRYFRLQVAPIIEGDLPIEFLFVTLIDVTESTLQRQKFQALHRAELALADLTAQEIFEMDVDQRIDLLKDNILHYTKDLLNFDVIEIRLLDERTGLLEPLLSAGIDSEASKKPLYARAEGNGVTGFVVATGHSYLCEDTTNDPLYLDGLIGAKSSLTVPLKVHDQIIGSFNVESPEVGAFKESDLEFLESFARGVAAALNTFELLVAQRSTATRQSVEAIHNVVAIPIDKILIDTVQVIESYIGHDPEVIKRLRSVLANAREIKNSIQKVGEAMIPAESLPEGLNTPQRPALRGKRILVIDADEQVRTSAHQLLERQGCVVETAHQGQDAILMIRNSGPDQAYDAIIADIRLPDISGYELLMKLKEMLENPPLILLTGFGYDPGHSIVKARQAGLRAGAILYKPFRLAQLLETVEATVKNAGQC
jgi:CheY-like chemotaxis protein